MTSFERLLKAQEIWTDRNRLIDLREAYGRQHGADEIYEQMQRDIENMAQEAEHLERLARLQGSL